MVLAATSLSFQNLPLTLGTSLFWCYGKKKDLKFKGLLQCLGFFVLCVWNPPKNYKVDWRRLVKGCIQKIAKVRNQSSSGQFKMFWVLGSQVFSLCLCNWLHFLWDSGLGLGLASTEDLTCMWDFISDQLKWIYLNCDMFSNACSIF